MPKYSVVTTITFVGEIEADNEKHAQELGYYYDNLRYESVYDVEVEEVMDTCAECDTEHYLSEDCDPEDLAKAEAKEEEEDDWRDNDFLIN